MGKRTLCSSSFGMRALTKASLGRGRGEAAARAPGTRAAKECCQTAKVHVQQGKALGIYAGRGKQLTIIYENFIQALFGEMEE